MRKIDLTSFQVATSETARQINRRIALNFIRHHQPMSRADLARRSGLQRSTVSSIIDQLIEEGWVTEGAIGRAPRGRRPRFLHLNVERAGIIGVELRPQTTTVGLAGVDARFVAQTAWPTPDSPDAFVRELAEKVALLRQSHPQVSVEGMGISLPGRVDHSGTIVFAPNLGWPAVSLREKLETAIGMPVTLENAANACALAELWFGRHGDHVQNLVAVTVSEGIGVGLLLNGQLVHGANAMTGEFGHVTLDENGPPCRCGRRGCWERYASNSAAIQYYTGESTANPAGPNIDGTTTIAMAGAGAAANAAAGVATSAALSAAAGAATVGAASGGTAAAGNARYARGRTTAIAAGAATAGAAAASAAASAPVSLAAAASATAASAPAVSAAIATETGSERHRLPSAMMPQFEDLLRLADNGDARAIEAIERMARFLGIGLAALVNGLAPEVIVIIGEVTGAWARVGPIVTEIVQQRTLPHAATRIVPTDPATQPRLRGAITLVVQEHFGAPNVA